ncbi:MAG: type II toxin-antitoxin system VapC family toxin [Nevskiaceae bacterium]
MLLVDTNVLVDVFGNDPDWAEWSLEQLRAQSQVHELAINPVVYAEVSVAFATLEALDDAIAGVQIQLHEIPRAALFLAGKAFVKYRRTGGPKGGVLADFFIGAHAAVAGWPILTRDPARYRRYFPTVRLITP